MLSYSHRFALHFFSPLRRENVSNLCFPGLVRLSLTLFLLLHCLPNKLIPFLCVTPLCLFSPQRAMTILRENLLLFTLIITLLLLVIEPVCLVNGIVLEYNTQLNEAVVDHE